MVHACTLSTAFIINTIQFSVIKLTLILRYPYNVMIVLSVIVIWWALSWNTTGKIIFVSL